MDPLSVSASILALLQSTGAVMNYLRDVKGAPKEIKRIRMEVFSVYNLLVALQVEANQATKDDACPSTLNSLNVPNGSFQQFHSALDRLTSKLAPVQGWRRLGKGFKWPFEKEEMQEILNTVERLKTLFSLARQNDHIALSRAIKGDAEKIREKVNEINIGFANLHIDQRHENIRRWLSAPDPSSNYNKALKHRHGNSGDWFLGNIAYKDWLSDSGSLLWLYGIPGCGKTILSSTIIQATVEYCNSQINSVVLYFYFDFNDIRKQQHEQMIRSLVCQLLEHYTTIPSALDALYTSCKDGAQQTSLEGLLPTLHQMLTAFQETYIVLDALDECGDRTQMLCDINDICDWRDVSCRMLVLSRRERDIEDELISSRERGEALCITKSQADADIRHYIHDRLRTDRKLKLWEKEHSEIEEALMHKANGMFQWAVCQLNVLCSCRSVLQLRKALGSLPETLYKTYDRILCKINKEDSQFAFKILQWLAFCVRPLRLREVAEVIAIDVTETPRFDPQKRFRDLRDILEICSSLISLDFIGESASDTKINTITGGDILTAAYDYTNEFDDTDIDTANGPWSKATISLAHFSVKEYLVSDRIWRGPASAYGLQELKCNERIAEDCLGYLLHLISPEISKSTALEDYPSPKKPTNYLSMTIEEYPLAQYAAKYWFEHYGLIERTESTALALVQELFLSKIEAFMNWLGLFDPDRTWLGLFDTDRPWWARPWTMGYRTGAPLYYASLLGLSESVALLIENGADVNAQGGWREYALKAASSSGHIEIVQLLLDRGADLDAHSGESIITALEGASCYGHIEIVQLLLDKGAHITTRGGHSPLTTALMRGHECIAHLLINKGAYLGTVSSRNVTTPLETAISYGSKSSVQLMLDKGADINIDATGSSNPLDSACFFGHEDIVQLLLDRGAVVNPQSLVATLAYGKTRILQMLLEHGGDLNQKDINGEAVCHYAASRGDVKVFELLASSGVDLTVTDKQGRNCLHVTSGYGYQDPIALLLRLGLDPNSIDHNGWTPLHWAARRGDVKTIVMLEDAGAVFSVETINGWTPDDVATFYGHKFNWKSTNTTVHHVSRGVDHKAGCAGCHKQVYGTRYKCMDCIDFDYCFVCKHSSEITHPGHRFIANPTAAKDLFPHFCHGCSMRVYETRYKCLDCDDFDYCLNCKPSSDETHPGHRFIKDPTLEQLRELWGGWVEEEVEALEKEIGRASSETDEL